MSDALRLLLAGPADPPRWEALCLACAEARARDPQPFDQAWLPAIHAALASWPDALKIVPSRWSLPSLARIVTSHHYYEVFE